MNSKGSRIGDLGNGEIIHVQGGGRIIRATGRKDRHSKVYTSKGPRDRRVRLSAPTAIQFYDVQDRLGYDRPSKAVDWLINKAKHAIDNLSPTQPPPIPPAPPQLNEDEVVTLMDPDPPAGSNSHLHGGGGDNNNFCASLISPPAEVHVQHDSMMKSFFPMSSGTSSSLLNNLSRTGRIHHHQTGSGDLGLSLQTLQDHHNQDELLLSAAGGTNPVSFHDTNNNYPKPVHQSWNPGSGDVETETTRHVGRFVFNNSHSITPPQQLFYTPFINSAIFSLQRESNYPHLVHSSTSWNDRQFPSTGHEDHTQSSSFNVHFGSNFQVPARIHGEDIPEAEPNLIPQSHPNNSNSRNKQF